MNDTDRILEAIGTLTQQIGNLESELTGMRSDVQHIGAGQELSKKKLTASKSSYMPPSLSWPGFESGGKTRYGGRGL